MTRKFIPVEEVARGWMGDPAFRAEYEALDGEFEQAKALIRARIEAQVSRLDPVDEAEALDWIESISEFDELQ